MLHLSRYLELFPMGTTWFHQQVAHGQGWPRVEKPNLSEMLRMHLDRGSPGWIASRAATESGVAKTELLILDLDSKPDSERLSAWERASRLLDMLGRQFAHVTYTSPGGGYHVYYFLDRSIPVADLVLEGKSKTCGPMYDLCRAAGVNPREVEIFPLANQIIRWPLGHRQFLVDEATGEAMAEDDAVALIEHAEVQKSSRPLLSPKHLLRTRPAAVASCGPSEGRSPGGSVCEVGAGPDVHLGSTADEGIAGWRFGLTSPKTRHRVMYLIARVMLRAPETISPYGFDITRPAADQLYEWLKAKHNGFSADYSRDPSAMKWKRQCAAYIRDARTARPPLDVRHRSRLTHGDWERVFQIGDKFSGRAAERYKVECVAAAWLSFAHWSREKRQATVQPDGDVRVPLSARTRRRFPFCSNHSAEKRWTDVLQRLDSTFLLLAPGDRRDRKAAVFNVPLDSLGTGAALPLDPAHAAEILSAVKKRERLKVHHAWQVKQRFTPSEIATRYGSGARAIARFQLPRDRKDGATGALTGVRHPDTPSSGQPLATSAPPEQTNQ